jgi:SPP1 family predicted phage head-tail adaptor
MASNSRTLAVENRRARMTLEAPVETTDALGGASITYQPIVTLWARIEARSGAEKALGGRLEGTTDTRITLRWRGGIDTRMRFAFGARIFVIRAAFDPDGRKRDLVCLCQEISA